MGDEQMPNAQKFQYPQRKSDLLHRIALVVMKTPGHSHDRLASQNAKDQFTFMTLDGGNGEVGNIGVVKFGDCFDIVGQVTQTGAQNNADTWLEISSLLKISNSFLNVVV